MVIDMGAQRVVIIGHDNRWGIQMTLTAPETSNLALVCPECGKSFVPNTHRSVFCLPSHQRQFHDRNRIRGQVAIPFLLSWRQGKRGRTEDTAYALAQLSAMADKWAAEDRAEGRRPDMIVSRKRLDCWSAADLK